MAPYCEHTALMLCVPPITFANNSSGVFISGTGISAFVVGGVADFKWNVTNVTFFFSTIGETYHFVFAARKLERNNSSEHCIRSHLSYSFDVNLNVNYLVHNTCYHLHKNFNKSEDKKF